MIRRSASNVQSDKRERKGHTAQKYVRKTGMNAPLVLSDELRALTGLGEISNRSQVLSEIGKYIRANNLYAMEGRKFVVCDSLLSALLNTEGTILFQDIQRFIKHHLTDPSEMGPEYEARAIDFFEKYLAARGALASWHAPHRTKDPRGLNSAEAQRRLRERGQGMFAEVYIEQCLRPLCNGNTYMSRPAILKSVWAYIKNNNLQDPSKRRRILVSETLRDALRLPDVEWIDTFQLGGYVFKLTSSRRKK
ncbi:hypothetical protein BWQ96_01198 [Gracilariopsis chorda]|uniref:DM2 domain-containing protein n=1 Tax=Gracilariopsis chorda TaxID=448386 RepID=A0A2V3J6Q8_9FLOR|nr:hypothetical protein BWQ96_01198 [Gracilariopsis chorda]|eukprot:PXF49060.1 hypothetical protein BWQ96_01198 [Gracilariopsis chorda]